MEQGTGMTPGNRTENGARNMDQDTGMRTGNNEGWIEHGTGYWKDTRKNQGKAKNMEQDMGMRTGNSA
jgi:midasin (ATPase involved in ribosome maturation)